MSKPPACIRKHCSTPAFCLPVVRIPAVGGAKENALTLPLRVPFCSGCAKRANVGEFLGEKSRAKVRRLCKTLGDARPDFKAAWLDWQPLS